MGNKWYHPCPGEKHGLIFHTTHNHSYKSDKCYGGSEWHFWIDWNLGQVLKIELGWLGRGGANMGLEGVGRKGDSVVFKRTRKDSYKAGKRRTKMMYAETFKN